MQCKVMDKRNFELGVYFTSKDGIRRRLTFTGLKPYSYTLDNITRLHHHSRIPIAHIIEGTWMNLQINLKSFMDHCLDPNDFECIDIITISGFVLLKKILLTRFQLPDSFPFIVEQKFGQQVARDFEWSVIQYRDDKNKPLIHELPQFLDFKQGVAHMNQVITYERMLLYAQIQEVYQDPELLEHSIWGPRKGKFHHPAVAFMRRNVSHGPPQAELRVKTKNLKVYDQNVHPVLSGRGPKMIEYEDQEEQLALDYEGQAGLQSSLEQLPAHSSLLPQLSLPNNHSQS
jgi:hypothetical protein